MVKVNPMLGPAEQEARLIYAIPEFIAWLDTVLSNMESVLGAEDTPLEQVDALFANFAEGQPMQMGREFRQLKPGSHGIWEMRTPDIRIFGWFPQKDIFVAARGNDASFIKEHRLYAGYIGEVVRVRDGLDLNNPKFLAGARIEDVVST